MDDQHLIQMLGVSLALGLLVGMQRERRADNAPIAGIRTFALITALGSVLSLAGPAALAAGLLGVVAYFALGNYGQYLRGEVGAGMTTEFAALVMYGVGALVVSGYLAEGAVVGGATAVLLHLKPQLHKFVDRVTSQDFRGIIQLALIGLIVLPVLPDETYGPYDVLNPRKVWLMVVLIVGISLTAYAAYRLLGAKVGSVLGGVLGGFISSTATTVSYARQAGKSPDAAPVAALVILIASTIVNIRVLIEIGAVAPGFLRVAAPPIGAMLGVMALLCGLMFWKVGRSEGIELDHDNPAQLKAALVFGALYAVVIFVVAAVKTNFGEEALYVVAVISGLTDVDAITLSTAELVDAGRVSADTGWRVVLVAAMANLVFKGGIAAVLGNLRLGAWVGALFGVSIAAGLAIVLLWPASGEPRQEDTPPAEPTAALVGPSEEAGAARGVVLADAPRR